MPVYHFTIHAYQSWTYDNPNGFVKRARPGVHAPDARLAAVQRRLARAPAVRFSEAESQFLIDACREVAERRKCIYYGGTVVATHIHAVIGWRDARTPQQIQTSFKRGLGYLLSKHRGKHGVPLLSRGGAPEPVRDMAHLYHLLHFYFPNHNSIYYRVDLTKLKPRTP